MSVESPSYFSEPQVTMERNQGPRLQLSFSEADWPAHNLPPITRPIHYLGSKLRIVNQIRRLLDQVDPARGPVCDLFAGSGTVSNALSPSRNVIAVDIQEYSRVLCSALLNPAEYNPDLLADLVCSASTSEHSATLSWALEPLVEYEQKCLTMAAAGQLEPLCDLLEYGSLVSFEHSGHLIRDDSLLAAIEDVESRLSGTRLVDSPASMVVRYFGGVYFSYSQACQLDMLLESVASLPLTDRDTFLAAILSTASQIVNTVGKQFAQPLRPRSSTGQPKPSLLESVSRDRSHNVMDTYARWVTRYLRNPRTGRYHQVIRQDYREALSGLGEKVAVVYADPPYTRDHYSRYYHVLETLCLRDNPRVSTVRAKGRESVSRGIYRVERHQSPFCIASKAPAAFAALFDGVRSLGVPLVLSYSPYDSDNRSRPRLMTISQLEDLAKRCFSRVVVHSAGRVAHSKLTSTDNTVSVSHNAESLFICQP